MNEVLFETVYGSLLKAIRLIPGNFKKGNAHHKCFEQTERH